MEKWTQPDEHYGWYIAPVTFDGAEHDALDTHNWDQQWFQLEEVKGRRPAHKTLVLHPGREGKRFCLIHPSNKKMLEKARQMEEKLAIDGFIEDFFGTRWGRAVSKYWDALSSAQKRELFDLVGSSEKARARSEYTHWPPPEVIRHLLPLMAD